MGVALLTDRDRKRCSGSARNDAGRLDSKWSRNVVWAFALLACVGCRSLQPLPKVNITDPGWQVRQGQAIWRLPHHEREIAGDVLVATGPGDHNFVQFSKSPFSLVTAQSTPTQWEAEFPPQNKHYAGHGAPPLRLFWLYLPRVLTGKPPPKGWIWQHDNTQWRLENPATGESLEGYFDS